MLTENRRHDGLFLDASIHDNIALAQLGSYANAVGWLKLKRLTDGVVRIKEAVRLSARGGLNQPVKTLSGGNQQKVVLARWLLAEPSVLILDEPTRAI